MLVSLEYWLIKKYYKHIYQLFVLSCINNTFILYLEYAFKLTVEKVFRIHIRILLQIILRINFRILEKNITIF